MSRWLTLGMVCALTACCDPYNPEFSQRQATEQECPLGGTVLLVDATPEAVLCNQLTNEMVLAHMPQLIRETVSCTRETQDRALPYQRISYNHARLYDGSLFVAVNCDTAVGQDAETNLFASDQAGAVSDAMHCNLVRETSSVIRVEFDPNFQTRRLIVTENNVVATDQSFDTDCTVVAAP